MTRKFLSINNVRPCWQSGMCCFSSARLDIALIAFGIILRLKHYFTNSSFWLDEAWLAMDISTRTFGEIVSARIFSYDLPTPPPGFNLIEKCFITVFGNNEYVFRLFPLLCGLAAIFLFYGLVKKLLSCPAVSVALAFFVCSDILIYNSSQLKQYSSGVFVVLLLYYMMMRFDASEEMTTYRSLRYGLAGGMAIMMFYPSSVILAGIGGAQIVSAFSMKDWERFKALLFSVFLWIVFFAVACLVYSYYMFDNRTLPWLSNPHPAWSVENLKWAFEWIAQKFLVKTAGLAPFWFGICFIVIGSVSFLRREKRWGFVLGLPILIGLLATILKVYPTKERFFLAFLPGLLIIFADGAVTAMQHKRKVVALLSGVFLAVLFIYPVKTAVHSLKYSYSKEEMRPVVRYLKEHQQPGDALFINNSAQYGYIYYHGYHCFTDSINPFMKIVDKIEYDEKGRLLFMRSEQYDFDGNGAYQGIEHKGDLITVFEHDPRPFRNNRRTWILLTHIPEDTRGLILELLNRHGTQLRQLKKGGSALFLYDLSTDR